MPTPKSILLRQARVTIRAAKIAMAGRDKAERKFRRKSAAEYRHIITAQKWIDAYLTVGWEYPHNWKAFRSITKLKNKFVSFQQQSFERETRLEASRKH